MSGGKAAKGDFYFLWQPHPEIQFLPFEKTGGRLSATKATKPVTVIVHGKAKDGGDDLGEDKATITAQVYEVKLSQPQHRPPQTTNLEM